MTDMETCPNCGWPVRRDCLCEDNDQIIAAYRDLIRAIGGGFHPDTRGENYDSIPETYTAESIDNIVDDAFGVDDPEFDPYDFALDMIHEMEH